ncbi:MAG: fatty acid desaturase type 2 [Candidatus Peregrinibacteria bacterium Greene0416_19]|nr:MAG: fatty acid desaturase type 2 [Candidatus Peregrinibacteria bacterium Greene0416_19]
MATPNAHDTGPDMERVASGVGAHMQTHVRTDETAAMVNRADTMRELDARLGQMRAYLRTDIHGITQAWQPADYLPSFANQHRAFGRIRAIQAQMQDLPPELLTVLIGDTLTEEGLPDFTAELAGLNALPPSGHLHRWFRGWAGEEQRHQKVLANLLWLSGRVDMKAYEQSVQLFLQDGVDLGIDRDPYRGFVYTSFQELATQRSHANVAKLANKCGNPVVAEVCGQVAADEGHHAQAYMEFVRVFFELDPDGMMCAVRDMWQRLITMPAHHMREVDPSGKVLPPGATFAYFSAVAQKTGVYTVADYAQISARLLEAWKVAQRNAGRWEALPVPGLGPEGNVAQQQILCRQRVIERVATSRRKVVVPEHALTWILKSHTKP